MRVKLEAIANVAVIVVALAAGYVVLVRYVAACGRFPRAIFCPRFRVSTGASAVTLWCLP